RLSGCRLNRVLEIGTGWIPTIPHLFHAAGAGQVIMTDVEALLDDGTREMARRFVIGNVARIGRHLGMSSNAVRANLERPFDHIYMHPFDRKRIATASIDLVYSRTVLEHIRPAHLAVILQDGRDY